MKRYLSILLALVVFLAALVSFSAASASSEEEEYQVICPECRHDTFRVKYKDMAKHYGFCFNPSCHYEDLINHTRGEKIPAVPATCTEPGSTEGYYCLFCRGLMEEPKKIEPLGHDWEEIGRIDPTPEKDGSVTYKCRRCGEIKEEKLPSPDGFQNLLDLFCGDILKNVISDLQKKDSDSASVPNTRVIALPFKT